MKNSILLIIIMAFVGCSTTTNDLTVKGQIKGLKKGTLYLKKANDSVIVVVDSVSLKGNGNFEFNYPIQQPEMFYLHLDKNSAMDDNISFFADKGITEINTTVKQFSYDAKIKGSKQQEVLEQYNSIIAKFNNKNLELIKANFDARKAEDTTLLAQQQTDFNNLTKRRYLYTVNFAINNKDSEVAPYLALSEIYDANITLLDTINKALTPKIKASLYGKKLQEFIDKIKAEEAEKE